MKYFNLIPDKTGQKYGFRMAFICKNWIAGIEKKLWADTIFVNKKILIVAHSPVQT